MVAMSDVVPRSLGSLFRRNRCRCLPTRYSRTYASAVKVDRSGLDEPLAFASTSDDPWFNLSYEEWLFRNTPTSTPILYFYRNRPSVIIGRNQNPWKETNPELLKRDSIPLLRRRSGGGAVFHDYGNTNFSLIIPRSLFSRSLGANIVSTALRDRMHIPGAGVNERGDLILKGEDGANRKISGSAYKIVSQRAYHHGTMLISSDLNNLGRYLRGAFPDIETKGVDSVRSPVTNLQSASPSTNHEQFIQAVTKEFGAAFNGATQGVKPQVRSISPETWQTEAENEDRTKKWGKIDAGVQELKSWEWVFGQTPEFSQRFEDTIAGSHVIVKLNSKHAIIKECSITVDGESAEELEAFLRGRSYGKLRSEDATVRGLSSRNREVYAWLARKIGGT